MSDAIASQEFSLDLQSGGVHDTSRLSSEQKAQLKDAFKDIQGDLKKLYSQALMVSPGFSATVAFEVSVSGSGHLQIRHIRPTSSNDTKALAVLSGGMKRLLEGIVVDRRFQGMLIRGENVFVH